MKSDKSTRDLGFGTVVGAERRQRLLNRDGTFTVGRRGLGWHARFQNMFEGHETGAPTLVDVARIHDIEPDGHGG